MSILGVAGEVDGHLRDSSQTVPDVLHVLQDINRMAEVAAVQVLDQTEALRPLHPLHTRHPGEAPETYPWGT